MTSVEITSQYSKILAQVNEMLNTDNPSDRTDFREKLESILNNKTRELKDLAHGFNCEKNEEALQLLTALDNLWDKAKDDMGYTISRRGEIVEVSDGENTDDFGETLEKINTLLEIKSDGFDSETFSVELVGVLEQKTGNLKEQAHGINCDKDEKSEVLLKAINNLWDHATKKLGYKIKISTEGVIIVSHSGKNWTGKIKSV